MNVHQYVRERRSLRAAGWRVARAVLRDPSYFKFTFVRHPLPRLVSAYANKFLDVRSPAWPTIRAIHARLDGAGEGVVRRWLRNRSAARRRDLTDGEAERSVTFRQFVEYVVTQSPQLLDVHWRPQHLFLGAQSFDWIGRFERLAADFAVVQQVLSLDTPLSTANRSCYGATHTETERVADWPASQLRNLTALPSWRRFYTPELEQLVVRFYAVDFERFGYEPNWPEASDRAAAAGGVCHTVEPLGFSSHSAGVSGRAA